MAKATLVTEQLEGWAPGTRHYRTSDGQDFAVEADPIPDTANDFVSEGGGEAYMVPADEAPVVGELLMVLGETEKAVKLVVRPTVIFACTPEGAAIDLTPLHSFTPGTSHEDALRGAGYEL